MKTFKVTMERNHILCNVPQIKTMVIEFRHSKYTLMIKILYRCLCKMLKILIVKFTQQEKINIYFINNIKQKKQSSNHTNIYMHRYYNTKH